MEFRKTLCGWDEVGWGAVVGPVGGMDRGGGRRAGSRQ